MSDNPGFLETLREQQMTQGPEEIPVDPTHPNYVIQSGGPFSPVSPEAPEEQNVADIKEFLSYQQDSLIITAMQIANDIPGVEFESYEDWEKHVDKVVAKIKANRS